MTEPWFRVREVVFHDGALWTTEAGRLTEGRVYGNSRQLARLAAAVPGELWGEDFASGVDTRPVRPCGRSAPPRGSRGLRRRRGPSAA